MHGIQILNDVVQQIDRKNLLRRISRQINLKLPDLFDTVYMRDLTVARNMVELSDIEVTRGANASKRWQVDRRFSRVWPCQSDSWDSGTKKNRPCGRAESTLTDGDRVRLPAACRSRSNLKQLKTCAGSVFAQQTESNDPTAKLVSTKTRAEVIAGLEQVQANGAYVPGGVEVPGTLAIIAKKYDSRKEAVELAGNSKAKPAATAKQVSSWQIERRPCKAGAFCFLFGRFFAQYAVPGFPFP